MDFPERNMSYFLVFFSKKSSFFNEKKHIFFLTSALHYGILQLQKFGGLALL
jgi:hypothetical protein